MSEEPAPGKKFLPVAMSIAGSDSGGGAGVQMDLRTFSGMGVWGTCALSCVTAQNPASISAVEVMPPELVRRQMEQVAAYFPLAALKTGILPNKAIIGEVIGFLKEHAGIKAVIDPVLTASSGRALMEKEALSLLKERLLPLASLITPNLDEAEALAGVRPTHPDEMLPAAIKLQKTFGGPVYLKGGHLDGDCIVDVLVEGEKNFCQWETERIPDLNTHGSGCLLSAAITAGLALAYDLKTAVEKGRDHFLQALHKPLYVSGRKFIGNGGGQ